MVESRGYCRREELCYLCLVVGVLAPVDQSTIETTDFESDIRIRAVHNADVTGVWPTAEDRRTPCYCRNAFVASVTNNNLLTA